MPTKIEWTGETWNPIRARDKQTGKIGWFCEHASDGCRFCYAETMNRWRGNGIDYIKQNRDQIEIFIDEKTLLKPKEWQKSRTIFPCSMTDIAADFITTAMLDQMFRVMGDTAHHTYQVLTKRPDRMRQYLALWRGRHQLCEGFGCNYCGDYNGRVPWIDGYAFRNLHLGTSIEQRRHLSRLDDLRATPAALRWISFEPLLEDIGEIDLTGIGWCVIGGESGHNARPYCFDWAQSIIDQCARAGVACFHKQVGSHPIGFDGRRVHLRDKKGGDPGVWPEQLRVRQMPRSVA